MTVPVTRALFVTKEKLHCLPSSMALLRENRSRDKLLQKAYKSLIRRFSVLREGPPENHAVLKFESTSTLSDFVYILHGVTY